MRNSIDASASDKTPSKEFSELEKEERKQLIETLLARGEFHIVSGDLSGLDLFEAGAKLDPHSPSLFYRQGLALFELGTDIEDEKILFLANKKFKRAARLDPGDEDVWHAWGNSLFFLGTLLDESLFFEQAKAKFTAALQRATGDTSELYWDIATTQYHIGRHSGEPLDIRLALNAFKTSSDLNPSLPTDFWVDYGKTHLLLANRLGDISQNIKTIHMMRKALSIDPSHFEAWETLASALCSLFACTQKEEHFTQANECFTAAHGLRPHKGDILLRWARFLLSSGKTNRPLKRLHTAIEKCRLALACECEESQIWAVWSEALAHIGLLSDRLDLITEAENKVAQLIEHTGDDPALWYTHGICLQALGAYFNDEDYYYQAVEKFQEGLSLNRSLDSLWHAMATCYASIAFASNDTDALKKAQRFFNKAIHLQTSSAYLADFAACLAKWGGLHHNQSYLEHAQTLFEHALYLQKNSAYLPPQWLFNYATTLNHLGGFHEDETLYVRAIEIFSHVLMIDPDFPHVHHHIALAYMHLGDLTSSSDIFCKAASHFRIAQQKEEDHDQITLDWALCLISLSEHLYDREMANNYLQDAEHKLIRAARLGNTQAFYYLACLAALLRNYDAAFSFLDKADQFDALPSLEEIQDDEWLDNIRHLPEFHSFITEQESRQHQNNL